MSNGLVPFGNLEIVGNGFIEPTLNEKATQPCGCAALFESLGRPQSLRRKPLAEAMMRASVWAMAV